jgi:organic hydroperoxide reductase OsmC/OhrA
MSEPLSFTINLEQEQGYQFRVKFDWPRVPELLVDEPEPLGAAAGPNAARLVAAAVANCLSASLLFCMRKFRQSPGKLRAEVTGTLARNERGRLRIGGFDVSIHLADEAASIGHFDRCLHQFEDFCVVTDSIRQGIPVRVQVLDSAGRKVHEAGGEPAAPHVAAPA